MVLSHWKFTQEERDAIMQGADLFIQQANFGGQLQPILPSVHLYDTDALTDFVESHRSLHALQHVPIVEGTTQGT
jgi:hypothetical protein